MSEWQPIETAPKDGTYIDLYDGKWDHRQRFPDCYWQEETEWEREGWYQQYAEVSNTYKLGSFDMDFNPTHWMPQPEPPK